MKSIPILVKFAKNKSIFYTANELFYKLREMPIVWSWGLTAPKFYFKRILTFRVSGHHFKGLVAIAVNSSDLFCIRLIKEDKIIHSFDDIYIDCLVATIDDAVERIPAYK